MPGDEVGASLGGPRPPALSAIVLGYQAGETLLGILDSLHRELSAADLDFEVVVVANYHADHDADATPDVARRWASSHPGTVVVAEPKEGAMGWDMRSGLEAASGRFRLVVDGDGQNPTADVVRAYQLHASQGADVVKGRRSTRGDGIVRKVISTAYNFVFGLMFGTRGLGDINGKPKGITAAALERMNLRSDDWFADAEIVLEARRLGLRIDELPVRFEENRHRASFVNWRTIFEFARNMIARRAGRSG